MPPDAYKMYHRTAAAQKPIKQPRPDLHPGPRELNSPTLLTGTGWAAGRAAMVLRQQCSSKQQGQPEGRFSASDTCRRVILISCLLLPRCGRGLLQVEPGTRAHTVPVRQEPDPT